MVLNKIGFYLMHFLGCDSPFRIDLLDFLSLLKRYLKRSFMMTLYPITAFFINRALACIEVYCFVCVLATYRLPLSIDFNAEGYPVNKKGYSALNRIMISFAYD
jgi:hypothetical protein